MHRDVVGHALGMAVVDDIDHGAAIHVARHLRRGAIGRADLGVALIRLAAAQPGAVLGEERNAFLGLFVIAVLRDRDHQVFAFLLDLFALLGIHLSSPLLYAIWVTSVPSFSTSTSTTSPGLSHHGS